MSDNKTPMQDPVAAQRLLGAAERIAGNPERTAGIDRGFAAAEGSIAGYIMTTPGDPEKNIRDLVSTGLVDPDNPCAVAFCEKTPGAHKPVDVASQLMGSGNRALNVTAAALKLRLEKGILDSGKAAVVFENMANESLKSGDRASAGVAAQGFVESIHSGLRERDRQGRRKPVEAEME